ncbi:integrase catalytic domain-containing protein [Trichonephila clavipes]|nr:integrase catalytic domain-containing protein [Trichonephila clavipes]
MGGLWEAGIKSVKYHLKRALGRSRLTHEEFETLIIQVEGILNSRPPSPISNDFDYFEPLAETNKGNLGNLGKMEYRLSEYSLQQRTKWMIEKDYIMRGTMTHERERLATMPIGEIGHTLRATESENKLGVLSTISTDFLREQYTAITPRHIT